MEMYHYLTPQWFIASWTSRFSSSSAFSSPVVAGAGLLFIALSLCAIIYCQSGVKSLVKLICVAGSTTTLRLDYRVALTTFLGLGVDKHWTNYSTLRRLKHGESVVTLSCRIGTLVCAENMVQRPPSDEANGTKGALGAIVDC